MPSFLYISGKHGLSVMKPCRRAARSPAPPSPPATTSFFNHLLLGMLSNLPNLGFLHWDMKVFMTVKVNGTVYKGLNTVPDIKKVLFAKSIKKEENKLSSV